MARFTASGEAPPCSDMTEYQTVLLAYASPREDRIDRNLRRTRKINRKLGGREGSINSSPDKPKRMHSRTYGRLTFEANAALFQAMRAVLDKAGG